MFEIIGGVVLLGMAVYVWKTIPPESQEIKDARAKFGKAPAFKPKRIQR